MKRIVIFVVGGFVAFALFVLAAVATLTAIAVQRFFAAADVPPELVFQEVREGWKSEPPSYQGVSSVLILGLDTVEGRSGGVLTDSLQVYALHVDSGTITSIHVPRDLWIEEYQTKINALYFYGKERYPERPERFTTEVVEQVLGIPIQYTIVLNLETVGQFIDEMGGVDVVVEHSFIDEKFPLSPGENQQTLYETVQFDQGVEHMSGDRALKYMRSRQSEDLEEGTDDARGMRQQAVISGVLNTLQTSISRGDLVVLGRLYGMYHRNFSETIPPRDIVALVKRMAATNRNLSVQALDIVQYLENPPVREYNQWVYVPGDPSWSQIRTEVQKALFGTISE